MARKKGPSSKQRECEDFSQGKPIPRGNNEKGKGQRGHVLLSSSGRWDLILPVSPLHTARASSFFQSFSSTCGEGFVADHSTLPHTLSLLCQLGSNLPAAGDRRLAWMAEFKISAVLEGHGDDVSCRVFANLTVKKLTSLILLYDSRFALWNFLHQML